MAIASESRGYPYMEVDVLSVDGILANVRTQWGRPMRLRADIRRGNGPYPREGERWIVDRTLGSWMFAACILSRPPIITGSTDDIPALVGLLAQLDEAGLIDNQTNNTRIRADAP